MGFLLDRDSRLTYPAQVQRQAMAQLVAGRLHPGDRLPSVRELARSLGVSRTTAERIHEALCDAMLVEVRPRNSVFIATPGGVEFSQGTEWARSLSALVHNAIDGAKALGISSERLCQLITSFATDGASGSSRVIGAFPLVATRDAFECMTACLGDGFPARFIHVRPDAQPGAVPRAGRHLLCGYYLRNRARRLAEAVGASLVYVRYNTRLLDEAMDIGPDEHRHFVTRDADNAETTRVFLASAYPEIAPSRYTVAAAAEWLAGLGGAGEVHDEVWATVTAKPLLNGRVAAGRLRVLHPLLADDFVEELRCLALMA